MGACIGQICSPAEPLNPPTFKAHVVKEVKPEPVKEVIPEPEEVMRPAATIPITLDILQGSWVNSVGAKIKVVGTLVELNGIPMPVHPITLNEEGTASDPTTGIVHEIKSIGRIWQLKGWTTNERIEWKEAPSMEVAEYARSVLWTKATEENMEKWNAQMRGLGYAGSSKDPLRRGIEGCMPGTSDAKADPNAHRDNAEKDKAELKELNSLITKYRMKVLVKVPPRMVIPDFSNRGHTGLSVEHVHYLATSFKDKGFQNRVGDKGHDIPVLVRESTKSELGAKSVENWRSKLKEEPGFPPQEHYEKLFAGDEVFTSLGNGHFNQALNLFLNECPSIYGDVKYTIGRDNALRDAVNVGVSAVVLKSDITLREREVISRLLNSKREYKWMVTKDGELSILDTTEDTTQCKQFEALSKVLDAVELNCLVRAELGVRDSHRVGQ